MGRLVLLILVTVGVWAEPSVYSGSGSSSRQVKRNTNAVYKLKQETARLREEVEGLRSIIEGLNRTVGRLQQKNGGGANEKLLNDMSILLDKINQNYVTKSELSRALKNGKVKHSARKESPKPSKVSKPAKTASSNGTLAKASSSALYSKGVRLVAKKRYTDAKKRFDILEGRGYKKAATHFYLGEIAYRTGKHTRAIDEYKQSAELDENAGYMDKLLLHTGLAMEKSGDKAQAKRFFQAIVDGYPGTSSARIAKKHL